jgi:transaldolase / glucose-6-phosphate isomerase
MSTVHHRTMTEQRNPLLRLEALGQSVWIDFIRRGALVSGEIRRLVEEDGVSGLTSNPSIFEKAIGGSRDYDTAIRSLALEGRRPEEILDILSVDDIVQVADLLRPIYDRTRGADGYASIEVSPLHAHDAKGTIDEAHRLWREINRPNLMVKVPGTAEGAAAIRQLTSDGLNVNVTLVFGINHYRMIAEAYIAGLEDRVRRRAKCNWIASVASFFVSRIDTKVDILLDAIAKDKSDTGRAQRARFLRGRIAVAIAKSAWRTYREIFEGARFTALARRTGARPQHLLWASTSTKDPEYSDVKYIEPLIATGTITTMPLETLTAYRDHGKPEARIEQDLDEQQAYLTELEDLGLHIDAITEQLEQEGIDKFNKPYVQLLTVLEERRASALGERVDRQAHDLGEYDKNVHDWLDNLRRDDFPERLWRKDPTLWKSDPGQQAEIRKSLGWLHVPQKMETNLSPILDFVAEVKGAGLKHVVLIGMGGSSMAALVFQRTFTTASEGLPLHILDTTEPSSVARIDCQASAGETLFVVSSKSGTTLEVRALNDYFYDRVKAVKGDRAGENFVAITDPGTPLADLAHDRDYRRVFLNYPDIGGRFSALSCYGIVPAALMGVNVEEVLIRAMRMRHGCDVSVPIEENPGIVLGAILAEISRHGADKVTFVLPPSIATMGLWLEQLIAESTGKEETGIVPIAGEELGEPHDYDVDRIFVYFRMKDEIDGDNDQKIAALQQAGFPVITIHMNDGLDIGQEFFRWEIAVATAGSILGINPFDQPNVSEAKEATERIIDSVRNLGRLPAAEPAIIEHPLEFYGATVGDTAKDALMTFFDQSDPWDYVALMAFLPEQPTVERLLDGIRLEIRNRLHLATMVGYGPRYLHSTGQLHKGGRDIGIFLQISADSELQVSIPGESFDFATLISAQAQADFEVLRKASKRILRVNIGPDVIAGLEKLEDLIDAALPRRNA